MITNCSTRDFSLIIGSWFAVFHLVAASGSAASVNFDEAEVGKPPPRWTIDITGIGEPVWTVEQDDSAPSKPKVLKQSGRVPGPSYPLCVKDEPALLDGFVDVKFRTVSGQTDQAAGVVWRFADGDNYYICRANALEDNVVLYKVEKGKRKSLEIVGRKGGYGLDQKVAPETWHNLRVEFAGPRFSVHFDGRHLFDVQDDTFKNPGKVGLWTKADSVTLFDDFTFGPSHSTGR